MKCKCGNAMTEIGTQAGGVFQRWCSKCGRMFLRSMNPNLPGEDWKEPSELPFLEEKQDMLTWLNGRALLIVVMHDGKPEILWCAEDATSIEDMILNFCRKHNIDMAKEIEGG